MKPTGVQFIAAPFGQIGEDKYMANCAYLYSSDQADWSKPELWHCATRSTCLFSKWSIPVSWFWFFSAQDLKMLDVQAGGVHWREPKFHAPRRAALNLFAERLFLLSSVLKTPVDLSAVVDSLARTVESWPGEFLFLDPRDILYGSPSDDEEDFWRFEQVLRLLDDPGASPDELIAHLEQAHCDLEWARKGDFQVRVVGLTVES